MKTEGWWFSVSESCKDSGDSVLPGVWNFLGLIITNKKGVSEILYLIKESRNQSGAPTESVNVVTHWGTSGDLPVTSQE